MSAETDAVDNRCGIVAMTLSGHTPCMHCCSIFLTYGVSQNVAILSKNNVHLKVAFIQAS